MEKKVIVACERQLQTVLVETAAVASGKESLVT